MRKTCTKCGEEKPLDDFPASRKSKSGRDSRCKACAARHAAEYRRKNPEKVKEQQRAAYLKNKESRDAYVKAWCQANKEKRAEHRKKWRDNNYEKAREVERLSRMKNRAKLLERKRKYAANNRPKYAAYSQKRRAALLRAIPPWADLSAIEAIFEECARLTRETGIGHHVDHIVPLQSPVVCGLHVESNLRIIDGTSNRSKGNKLLEE